MAETPTNQSTFGKKTTRGSQSTARPKYTEMVTQAIKALKERGGCSRQKILKYIMANFTVGEEKIVNTHVKSALKKLVATGMLKQNKGTGASGSFRLGEAAKKIPAKDQKAATTKKASTAKKPVTIKKATVAKKSADQKKATTAKKSTAVKKATTKSTDNKKKDATKMSEDTKSSSDKMSVFTKAAGEKIQSKNTVKTKTLSKGIPKKTMKKLTPAKLKSVKVKTSKVPTNRSKSLLANK